MADMNALIRTKAGKAPASPAPPRLRMSPPGQPIDPGEYQYVRDAQGWQLYPPGTPAPTEQMVVSADRPLVGADLELAGQKLNDFVTRYAARQPGQRRI